MNRARAAATVTWVYVAAFGLPALPVSVYLTENGVLPSLWGLFDMYGGPWSASLSQGDLVARLLVFLGVTLVAAWSAWLLRGGRKTGALLNVALLPVEALFWIGFALPIPWLFGVARGGLVAAAWKNLPEIARPHERRE